MFQSICSIFKRCAAAIRKICRTVYDAALAHLCNPFDDSSVPALIKPETLRTIRRIWRTVLFFRAPLVHPIDTMSYEPLVTEPQDLGGRASCVWYPPSSPPSFIEKSQHEAWRRWSKTPVILTPLPVPSPLYVAV